MPQSPQRPPGETATQIASPSPPSPGTADLADLAESRPGTRLERGDAVGRYVVLEMLGAGGMGVVYSAYDPELDRKVALKLIRPGAGSRPEIARLRLLREAQALAKLQHPAVITVHDVGMFRDEVFVAMEFVEGVDMAVWLRERERSWREVLVVMRQAGEGLAAAHAAGMVHRDFKPDNVLVGHDGRVRVLDFGLARPASLPEDERTKDADVRATAGLGLSAAGPTASVAASVAATASRTTDTPGTKRSQRLDAVLTQAGAIVGTPAYMAPEQHLGAETDARSDQFSFCVALYEALWRERPFAGDTHHQIAFHVLKGSVREPPRDGPTVPAWIRRIVVRGLAVDPDARWPDMRELLTALGLDPSARLRRVAIAGLGVALGASAIVIARADDDAAVSPCGGAERQLVGVWDDSVKQTVRDAFLATGLPYASDTFTTTARFLDGWAEQLVTLHTDACEATVIRKEQSQEVLDRQMACFARRVREAEELTKLLGQADDEIVERALGAVTALAPVDTCSSEAVLAGPPPLEGEAAERAATIEGMLARGRYLRHVAHYAEGLELVRDALGAARALEHAPTEARALLLLGQLENSGGEEASFKRAEHTLHEAAWVADTAGEDVVRAEAWKDLAWVVGIHLGRPDEAAPLEEHAVHALERAGGNAIARAEIHNASGSLARRRGKIDDAIREHREALRIRRAQLDRDDPRVLESLLNLANALSEKNELEAAGKLQDEAQGLVEESLGTKHPRYGAVLQARGLLAYKRGDYGSAVDLLRRALAVMEEARGPEHPSLDRFVHDLGETLLRRRDYEAALTTFSRAVQIRRKALDAKHPSLANSLTGVGRAEVELARPDKAVVALEEALTICATAKCKPTDLADTRFALARALAKAAPDRARDLAREARDAYAGATGDHATELAEVDAFLAANPRR